MSYRTRVKICGITRLEDALDAVKLGADALGFVFYPPSPRYIAPDRAAEIIARLPPFVTTTGLFVDADEQAVRNVLAHVQLGLLQFHGDETPAYCESFQRPWIKALRMQPGLDVVAQISDYAKAAGVLLDAWHPQLKGGTGETFDWRHWPRHLQTPLILAGGLTPENVAEAIHLTKPYAVDVSGGVEQGKGLKDFTLMQAFMAGVNAA